MQFPPLPGTPYVVTVYDPSDFHRRWKESRFQVAFVKKEKARWIFELKSTVKYEKTRYTKVEALPENPMEPIDFSRSGNAVLCRMLDNKANGSEWALANLAPDIADAEHINFFPDWVIPKLIKV